LGQKPLHLILKQSLSTLTLFQSIGTLPNPSQIHFHEAPANEIITFSGEKVLIVGGTHLTPSEAVELNNSCIPEHNLKDMIFPGTINHTGHTVINKDSRAKPDYEANFEKKDLILELDIKGTKSLTYVFDTVIFECLPPGNSCNKNCLKNAYDALKPGGKFIIYPGRQASANTTFEKNQKTRFQGYCHP
jgi:hypothetical protein